VVHRSHYCVRYATHNLYTNRCTTLAYEKELGWKQMQLLGYVESLNVFKTLTNDTKQMQRKAIQPNWKSPIRRDVGTFLSRRNNWGGGGGGGGKRTTALIPRFYCFHLWSKGLVACCRKTRQTQVEQG
jgi:hypothetical protein